MSMKTPGFKKTWLGLNTQNNCLFLLGKCRVTVQTFSCVAPCLFWNRTCEHVVKCCANNCMFAMIPAASWPDIIFCTRNIPFDSQKKQNHPVSVSATLFELNLFEFSADFCRSPTMGAVASGAEHVECSRGFCPQWIQGWNEKLNV